MQTANGLCYAKWNIMQTKNQTKPKYVHENFPKQLHFSTFRARIYVHMIILHIQAHTQAHSLRTFTFWFIKSYSVDWFKIIHCGKLAHTKVFKHLDENMHFIINDFAFKIHKLFHFIFQQKRLLNFKVGFILQCIFCFLSLYIFMAMHKKCACAHFKGKCIIFRIHLQ